MKRRRRDERGFVMLLVFLMAALIAISLYNEIPRVSFESQRAKEDLLIERGEQYQRAIKVFVRANKKYPATIKELESFNNHRFLRKQYVDPMTGKQEWRLVHIGPGGAFTDSLVNKPKDDKDKDKDKDKKDATTTATTTTANATLNLMDPNNPTGQPQGPTAVPPRRQSEMGGLVAGGVPGQPGYTGQPQIDPATGQPIVRPGQPGMPTTVPGMPGYPTGTPAYPGQPGQPYPGQPYPGQPYPGQPYPGQVIPGQAYPGQTGQPVYPGTGAVPGQPYPGTGAVPGQPYPVQPGQVAPQPGMPGYPYSTVPGAQGTGAPQFPQPGYAQAGGTGPASPTDAQKMIQDLLTKPRPAVMPGQATQPQMGQMIGGGIAGVASNADEEGIKIYNEHTNYKEWEFLYDYTKDEGPAGAQGGGGIGTPVNQLGTAPGQPANSNGSNQTGPGAPNSNFGTSPFGTAPGGSSPGFGTPAQQPPR